MSLLASILITLEALPLAFLTWEDIAAALATLADATAEGFVALTLGFAAKPAGVGFVVAAVLLFSLGTVAPVSFEVESLTVVSRIAGRDWVKMAYIVVIAGVIGVILGVVGVFTPIVDFVTGPILAGLLVGVGIILSFVALDLFRQHKVVGGVAIAVGIIAFYVFDIFYGFEFGLVYALVASVIAGVIAAQFTTFEPIPVDRERERLRLIPLDRFRFLRDTVVIRGVLALLALRVGTSISYTTVNADLADVEPNVNHTNILAGAGGAASGLFGGPPIEPIISGTAAAPNPVNSAALMMLVMGALLLLGVLPRLVRVVPPAAISGFLILLGAFIVVPENIADTVTDDDPFSGPVTLIVTAATFDPFLGLVAGVVVRFVTGLFL
jgi:adenine/guanine/hypoxanthine permease